jgi:hypothetical protein
MSRRCKGCGTQFRPDGDWQRLCWPCFRAARQHDTKEETMTTASELAEGEPTTSTELDTIPAAPITMFGSDPNVALRKMSEIAVALMDVVRDQKLSVRISGREYLTAEAWTLLGGLTGVTPVVEWTRPLEDGSGWEARVLARTLDERVIGAAESMCTRAESKWARRDEFQLRSMAQTRAIARALRAPLAPIVALSEYEASVAEEIVDIVVEAPKADDLDSGSSEPVTVTRRRADKIPDEHKPTDGQVAELRRLHDELAAAAPDIDWPAHARKIAGVPGEMLTRTGAEILLGKLDDELEHLADKEPTAA